MLKDYYQAYSHFNDVADVVIDKPEIDPMRATEEANQSLDFEALLATLDEEAVAPVTKQCKYIQHPCSKPLTNQLHYIHNEQLKTQK